MGNRESLKIIITIEGNCTTARLRNWKTNKVIKEGSAHCAPSDKFDLQTGSMIALARMFGDDVEFKVDDEEPLTKNEMMAKDCGYRLMRYGFPKEDGKYRVIASYVTLASERYTLYYNAEHKVFYSNSADIDLSDEKSIERYHDYWDNIIAWKRVE